MYWWAWRENVRVVVSNSATRTKRSDMWWKCMIQKRVSWPPVRCAAKLTNHYGVIVTTRKAMNAHSGKPRETSSVECVESFFNRCSICNDIWKVIRRNDPSPVQSVAARTNIQVVWSCIINTVGHNFMICTISTPNKLFVLEPLVKKLFALLDISWNTFSCTFSDEKIPLFWKVFWSL